MFSKKASRASASSELSRRPDEKNVIDIMKDHVSSSEMLTHEIEKLERLREIDQ